MLNIQIQACGLVLDLILIYFLQRHEKVGLHGEKLFRASLTANTILVVLDIISVFLIVYSDSMPKSIVEFGCKIYLASLVTAAYMGFAYSGTDIIRIRRSRLFQLAFCGVYVVGMLLVLASPVSYTHEGRVVYSYGAATRVTYMFAPFFILCALTLTIVYRNQMNAHRKRAVRLWMLLTIVAAGVQFVFPQLLLVGFASALGMLILYAELENPETNLDRTTGAFNYHCLEMYMEQLFDGHHPFSCMAVCLSEDWHVDRDIEEQILLEISNYLHGFSGTRLFRCVGKDFVLIYEDDAEKGRDFAKECREDIGFIQQKFEQPFEGVEIPAAFMYLPDYTILNSAAELIQIYQDYRQTILAGQKGVISLDVNTLNTVREFNVIKSEIVEALADDRIEVFLQPIYSVKKDMFVSAEALARLRNKDGSIMMPGKFIPVAEESGLIEHIGESVFTKTCNMLKDDNLKKKGIEYVEVNLSVSQCENEELADRYHGIMKHHGLKPGAINLEITESSSLNNRDVLLMNMDKLKEVGCSFSLDDFGTGESNLNYIVDMPVDIVKFDYSMVQDYFRSERARIVMDATVRMIKELGLHIVAEGVETAEQLEAMKKIGIDYIQGFYFSKPLPYGEFISFINERNHIKG